MLRLSWRTRQQCCRRHDTSTHNPDVAARLKCHACCKVKMSLWCFCEHNSDYAMICIISRTHSLQVTTKAASPWGRIASLIETCKINDVEPFAYLKAALTAIAAGHTQSRLDNLLPWNFNTSSQIKGDPQRTLTIGRRFRFPIHGTFLRVICRFVRAAFSPDSSKSADGAVKFSAGFFIALSFPACRN